MEDNDCIFCKIISGEIPAEKTYEDDNFIAFLDAKPKAVGHTILVSKNHFRNLLDMPASLGNEMLEGIKKVSLDLIKQKKAEGFNVIVNNEPVAGQVIFHAHIHIIPRKKDDGLKPLI
ncbi:MAG: HIT domain-containing protein [Candidatus Pacearchaeota archaeon]|jgi:histidine triad (HIT) family protein